MKSIKAVLVPLALVALCGLGASSAAPYKPPKVYGVDVFVVSDRVFVPGSRASVRVVTRAVLGLADSRPLPMAGIEIELLGDGGKKKKRLFTGRADVLGGLDADFLVPEWPDGSYEMKILARSPFGEREVAQTVQLKRTGRVLLLTDKPIYQPGQVIHLRALALDSHGLTPFANEPLRFEILDPKGNKVFKKELPTNHYGIASTVFQLADEINLGAYQIEVLPVREQAAETAVKTVAVKKYVLPKFKVSVETERAYYLPRQTVKGTVQADYFFGKPVAGGEVEIKASTFDAAFREFATIKGHTGKDGSYEFELKLPEYFVGQPLQKGDAVVRLEVRLTDTADHLEKATRSVPVAATPIRLDAVPEGGRLVAGVPNRIFVVATYPDGSPARAEVAVERGGEKIDSTRTDRTGLGVVTLTPKEQDMSPGPWQPRGGFGRARPGGQQVQTKVLHLQFSARDEEGRSCKIERTFSTDPSGDRVLVRTDKAIYEAGDVLRATVLSTAGDGVCYLDLIKNRQTVVTRSLFLKDGKGELKLPLGPDVFGTVELHAYKILDDGEIMRDARVLYVQPPSELSVTVSRDKPLYRPGEQALIRFAVADQDGKPRPAALGLIIVDEAVYALQELQPGLEKVYFTLEKELSDPKYQIEFGPADSLASLVKAEKLAGQRQRVAKVLLAKARPSGDPGLWVNPLAERRQKAEKDRHAFSNALRQYHHQKNSLGRRTRSGRWAYLPGLVMKMKKSGALPEANYLDPLGVPYTMSAAEKLWPECKAAQFLGSMELSLLWQLRGQVYSELHRRTAGLTDFKAAGLDTHLRKAFKTVVAKYPDMTRDPAGKTFRWKWLRARPGFRAQDFAAHMHTGRIQQIYYALSRYGAESQRWYRVSVLDEKKNAYALPANVLSRVIKRGILSEQNARDIWGRRFRVRKRKEPRQQVYYDHRLRFYEVYSTGPDGKPGTADDLVYETPYHDGGYRDLANALGVDQGLGVLAGLGGLGIEGAGGGFGRLGGRGRGGGMAKMARTATRGDDAMAPDMTALTDERAMREQPQAGAPAAPRRRKVRVREYFPETLLFEPSLITDEQGRAELKLTMADSITTWRMTASANGRGGGLGSTSHAIRVFQDFFVDIDLPAALTQNDEVSIPIVVYNYLKKPQRVRLELTPGDWFELSGGRVQEIQLDPSEVSATYYRIKVRGLGRRTLQVRADGSSMSDAIQRRIEVLPDGKEHNVVANGRLDGTVTEKIKIPGTAVAGASKILVRLYPGVFSQVIEGMESMLRLPGG